MVSFLFRSWLLYIQLDLDAKRKGIIRLLYISAQKIEQAKLILGTPSVTVADLSERLSFSSPGYFTLTFRKYTGMTPVAWQQRKTNPEINEKIILAKPFILQHTNSKTLSTSSI